MSMRHRRLSNAEDRAALHERLGQITLDSPRQWGTMTAHQMVLHLRDAFLSVTRRIEARPRDTWFTRNPMKLFALHSGIPWPHGVKTLPEVDQVRRGTGGGGIEVFARDVADLRAKMDEFCTMTNATAPQRRHSIFGPLTDEEWQHWAWRHLDHHLRQFGA